jgi:hypothetical protein
MIARSCSSSCTGRYRPVASTPNSLAISLTVMPGSCLTRRSTSCCRREVRLEPARSVRGERAGRSCVATTDLFAVPPSALPLRLDAPDRAAAFTVRRRRRVGGGLVWSVPGACPRSPPLAPPGRRQGARHCATNCVRAPAGAGGSATGGRRFWPPLGWAFTPLSPRVRTSRRIRRRLPAVRSGRTTRSRCPPRRTQHDLRRGERCPHLEPCSSNTNQR